MNPDVEPILEPEVTELEVTNRSGASEQSESESTAPEGPRRSLPAHLNEYCNRCSDSVEN